MICLVNYYILQDMYASVSFFRYIMFFSVQFCKEHNHPTNPDSLSKEKILLMPVHMPLCPMLHTAPFKQVACILDIHQKLFSLPCFCLCLWVRFYAWFDWKLDNAIMPESYNILTVFPPTAHPPTKTGISYFQTGSQTPCSDMTTEVVLCMLACFAIPFFISLKYAHKIKQIFELLNKANSTKIEWYITHFCNKLTSDLLFFP